jgi:hypothetical protein
VHDTLRLLTLIICNVARELDRFSIAETAPVQRRPEVDDVQFGVAQIRWEVVLYEDIFDGLAQSSLLAL